MRLKELKKERRVAGKTNKEPEKTKKGRKMKREIYNYYENEKKVFEGYDIPEKLKKIASLIMFRFNIDGICDGMYLCNVMANHSGSGDGCGTFRSDYVNPSVAAEFIQKAYGCNISKDNVEELTSIIEEIDLGEDVTTNMKVSLSRLKEELKRIHDEFRSSYIKKGIHAYEEKIAWMEKTNKIEKKIMVFEIEKDIFRIFGKFEFVDGLDENKSGYIYPVFYNLRAEKKSEDGSYEPYKPTSTTWSGRKITEEDMINSVVDAFILENGEITVCEMNKEMEEWLSSYRTDIALEIKGKNIPKRIYNGILHECMNLRLATNEYIYYSLYDEMRMYDAKEHKLCSDNYFAEVGYGQSCENIVKGTEILLWGELPENYAPEEDKGEE